MFISALAVTIAVLFAANIGASGTAAAMGAAYGGGAIRRLRAAVWLAGLCALAGALAGGSRVVTTISEGLIPNALMTIDITVIILLSACLSLYYANHFGIPLSTSEVTVGSLVGVGLALSQIYWHTLLIILLAWLLTPLLAFFISYGINRLLSPIDRRLSERPGRWKRWLTLLLIACGCYEAFSAGMNNVANAVGPIIGSGIMPMWLGILVGAVAMAIGAITLGGRVLETNGKKITELSLLQGSIVSSTGGSLVLAASFIGLPVPLTQATTMAIIACGGERIGFAIFRKPIVRRIMLIWVISPIISLFVSFILVKIIIMGSILYISVPLLLSIILLIMLRIRRKAVKLPAKAKKASVLSE